MIIAHFFSSKLPRSKLRDIRPEIPLDTETNKLLSKVVTLFVKGKS